MSPILARLYSEPWACTQEYLHALLRGVEQSLAAASVLYSQPRANPEPPDIQRLGGTGVIPIAGPILKNPHREELEYGACDIDHVRLLVSIAQADPTVERVVLHVASPGGTITGIPETYFALQELAEAKPLIAFTDTQACSAAYWLATAAQAIYATPSARLGSVGLYSLYSDSTEAMAKMGLKINAISVGSLKLAGAPFKPMSDEERAHFQAFCDQYAIEFKGAVLNGRKVDPKHLEGQAFTATDAVQHGLADGLVNSFEELLQLLSR